MRLVKFAAVTLAGVTLFLGACAAPAIKRTAGAVPALEPTPGLAQISTPPKPAAFIASELTVSIVECNQGADVWVGVTVTNTGGQPGTYPVVVKLNGVVARTGSVTLDAGASQNAYFVLNQTVDMPEFTTYKITIDDLEKDVGVI